MNPDLPPIILACRPLYDHSCSIDSTPLPLSSGTHYVPVNAAYLILPRAFLIVSKRSKQRINSYAAACHSRKPPRRCVHLYFETMRNMSLGKVQSEGCVVTAVYRAFPVAKSDLAVGSLLFNPTHQLVDQTRDMTHRKK